MVITAPTRNRMVGETRHVGSNPTLSAKISTPTWPSGQPLLDPSARVHKKVSFDTLCRRVGYVPSRYRGYPFAVSAGEGHGEPTLCFDRTSGLYRETPNLSQGEERFFDEKGNLTPFMQQLTQFLGQCQRNRHQTRQAAQQLADQGLLIPWTPDVPEAISEPKPLQGLLRVDSAALQNVRGATLEALMQSRALELAFAQQHALLRLGPLRALYRPSKTTLELDDQTLEQLKSFTNEPPTQQTDLGQWIDPQQDTF